MVKEYDTFVKDKSSLAENMEVELVIRDLSAGTRKYEARVVKARVLRKSKVADRLWLMYPTGSRDPDPLGIKIIEELGEGPR